MIARLFFCLVPALLAGLLGSLLFLELGVLLFLSMFLMGWDVTPPHKDRGEQS